MRTAGKVPNALDLERTVTETRWVQMARSSELKLAARSYRTARSLAVFPVRMIVRLPMAGR